MAETSYRKEYLPGYTGHVPKKNDIFGCTAGDINKIITGVAYKPSNFDVDLAPNVGKPHFPERTFYSKPPRQDVGGHEVQFGNASRYGNNWIGGPTNNLKAQHVPGYSGYVPNVKSENLFGKSFARMTGNAINKEYHPGVSLPENERFKTSTIAEYNKVNFRRLKDASDPAENKDKADDANFIDAEFQGIEIQRRNIYLEIPTVGYQGFKSSYRPPTTSISHRKDPFFNVNPLKPRLKETNIQSQPEFKTMTNGFQQAITSTQYREKQGLPDNQELRLPIAGYTGHRMGYRAQNFYGKNFRDCSIQSKRVQKMAL